MFGEEEVKGIIVKKMNTKDVGVNQGKKIKQIKKMAEEGYLERFKATHFGIMPVN